MVSAEREPIMGVWGLCPQRGPGAEPVLPHSTRCASQSLSDEAADLTAATVVSVASPTASFSAFSWYRTRDLPWPFALTAVPPTRRIQLYKLLHGRAIALRILYR